MVISINGMDSEMINERFQVSERASSAEEPSGPEDDVAEEEFREWELERLAKQADEILFGKKTGKAGEAQRVITVRESLLCFKKFITMFDKRVWSSIEDVAQEINPALRDELKTLIEDLDDAYNKAGSLTDLQVKEIGQKIVDHIVFMLEKAGRLRNFNSVEFEANRYKKELAQKDAEIEALKRQLAEANEKDISSVTQQRVWIKQLVGLAEYLHRESTLNKGEFARQNIKALQRIVQELTRISKQETLTERDLQDAQAQIEQAKTIYLSVRSGRIVTIPDLPKRVAF